MTSDFWTSTMLIERLVGVTVYALSLFFFYIKIKYAKSAKHIIHYLNIYLFVLCIMSFFYIPGENADLYRWRNIANSWVGTPFATFFIKRIITADTPLSYLLMYICQSTHIDGLLPMICGLIFFGNGFHIIKSIVNRYEVDSSSVAIGLFFLMSPGMLVEAISGVRCFVAFSIISRCICDEYIEGKSIWKSIPFYVFACLFHTAGLSLVAIRLLAFLFEKKRSTMFRIINIIAIIAMGFIALKFGDSYVDATLAKAISYTSHTTYQYLWEYIIGGIGLIIIVVNIYPGMKKNEWGGLCNNIAKLLLILCLFEFAFIGSYSIFHRYIVASTMVCTPMIILLCNDSNEPIIKRRNVFILCLIMLIIACVRGNMCGYKFFLL